MTGARDALNATRPALLSPRDQVDYLIGLGQSLYLAGLFGSAAELFDTSLERSAALPDRGGEISAWAGPWAHDARWWDRRARARRAYWQVLVAAPDGERVACLVAVTAGDAALEAIYD